MLPWSSHPARATKPQDAPSVRWLLAVALVGVGWLLAWAPAALGQAPTVAVIAATVLVAVSLPDDPYRTLGVG